MLVCVHVLLSSSVYFFCFYFVFFKQKTAYDLRISDCSSDVCSSDLPLLLHFPIVLLFLALVFEVFNGYLNEDSTPSAVKDPGSSKTSPAGRNAVTLLLYGGALSAALTVVFGLILSKEEGYSGSTQIGRAHV